mgnify:CR=1 FL=1
MEKQENILGTEKIGKLIKKFSIPCIISLLVNSLYNIVDQIFIGWGVGYLANGATNVVFPLVMLSLAFSLMFGDGTSAYFSLKLGQKKNGEAAKGVVNGIIASTVVAILIGVISFVFLPQLLNIFGCTDALRDYATGYGYIIAIGLPFMMIGTTLNSIIRADGNPKYAMVSMLAGAILNIILDPIFIFTLNWGIEGAAIATVISQILTFVINILYLKKFKYIELKKENIKIDFKTIINVLTLGISSFITQMSIVVVIAVENNLLVKYGDTSKFGAEIPITVLGIVMKIAQIVNSIIIGIAAGSQPIFGYNYGAQKYDRVKETLKKILFISIIIAVISTILFQFFPDKLILIFGSGNELYMEFAILAFRIYLMLYILAAIQIILGIFFQATGKSVKSAFISLSRQILFLIPMMIIFGHFFGIMGVLYAGAASDLLAFVIAIVLLISELKRLNVNKKSSEKVDGEKHEKVSTGRHIVITIAREYGSGGRYVGKLVAQKLGIKLYDKEFITKVAQKTGLSEDYISKNEQKMNVANSLASVHYTGLDNNDELFVEEVKLIKELAENESCVIVGRCADYVLRDNPNVLKVFIYSNMKNKVKRAVQYYGIAEKNAEKEIKNINKLRDNHYKHYTGGEWKNPENYDICVNSDALGIDNAVDMICKMVEK